MVEPSRTRIVKYILVIFNLVFAILGLIIVISGSIIVSDALNMSEFDNNNNCCPIVIFIISGAILFIISFIGCFGTIRESERMLKIFAGLLIFLLSYQIATKIALAIVEDDTTDEKFKDSIKQYNNSTKDSWDIVQSLYKCCGINSSKDWIDQELNIPKSCCTNLEADGDEDEATCPDSPNKYVSKTGCYSVMKQKIKENSKWITGIDVVIIVLEVCGIVMAYWLAAVIKKEEKDYTPKPTKDDESETNT